MRSTLLLRLAAGAIFSLSLAMPGIAAAEDPTVTPTETGTPTAAATPEGVRAVVVLFAKGPDLTAVQERLDALLAAIDTATNGEYKAHIHVVQNSEGDDVLMAVVKAKGDASLEGIVDGFVTDVEAMPGVRVHANVKERNSNENERRRLFDDDGDEDDEDEDEDENDGDDEENEDGDDERRGFRFDFDGRFGADRDEDGNVTVTTPRGTLTVRPGEGAEWDRNEGRGVAENARRLGESRSSNQNSNENGKSGKHRD